MSKPEDGGQAFPRTVTKFDDDHDPYVSSYEGMTLRQYAAIKAMQGILASSQVWVSPHDFDEIAKRSWGMADAMIAMLKAGGE